MKKTENKEKVSLWKILAWNSRPISLGAVTIIIGYLSLFCTDMLGMPSALVGSLLMASKVCDGVTDLFAGWIVDNTHTKLGKGRPYELCLIGVWVCMYALFATGVNWSLTMKCIWIFIIYTLIFSIFSTMLNAAESPYMIRAFGNSTVITKVASYGGVVISLGCMVVSISFPILVGSMGQTAEGWRSIMAIYAVILLVIGMIRFLFIKEQAVQETSAQNERIKIRDILSILKMNKYIWFFAIAVMIPQLITGMAAGTYYFSTVVGDISQYSTVQAFSMVTLLLLFFIPALSKKIMPMQLVMWSAVLGIAGCVVNFFAGVSMPLLIIGYILTGIASMPGSYLKTPIVMQIADYNEYKGQARMEAVIGSAANFFNKIGSALGSFILGILLMVGNYDGMASAQPDSALTAIRVSYSIVPAIFMLICIICCRAYQPLNDFTRAQKEKTEQEA